MWNRECMKRIRSVGAPAVALHPTLPYPTLPLSASRPQSVTTAMSSIRILVAVYVTCFI